MATRTSSRPSRALLILFVLIIALGATAFIQGAKSVRLGLDLRGGTSVTLVPRVATADKQNKLTPESIDQAVGIIRQRVNSLGVAESEVTAVGSGTNRQIVISVPGDTGRRIVELVGQTAELRFRQVLLEGPPATSPVDTATVASGDLTKGWTKGAPYDVILVDGAVEEVPDALTRQLAEGGRLAAAIVENGVTRLVIGYKAGDSLGFDRIMDAEAVVLPGFAKPKGFAF